METVKKICPQTKKVFFGRSNQIYINRKAQQDFNNIKARKKRLIKSPTDRILDSDSWQKFRNHCNKRIS